MTTMTPFDFRRGTAPLLISFPHAGTELTPAVRAGLVEDGLLLSDTDWHIDRLYAFAAELGASLLVARYSRYVVDLNRPPDDAPLYATATPGLFPGVLFDGGPLFRPGLEPVPAERQRYLDAIWRPYHATLATELERIRAEYGYALLYDAHSIRSAVPALFEGRLPDFNIGTNDGASADPELTARIAAAACAAAPAYSHVVNGRFKGGYITRHYGRPDQHVHAVQMEQAQCTYMDETPPFDYRPERAASAQAVLKQVIAAALAWGRERYGR